MNKKKRKQVIKKNIDIVPIGTKFQNLWEAQKNAINMVQEYLKAYWRSRSHLIQYQLIARVTLQRVT